MLDSGECSWRVTCTQMEALSFNAESAETRRAAEEEAEKTNSFLSSCLALRPSASSAVNCYFLNSSLSILYCAILSVMLRRDRPLMRAQRPTWPRVFFSARRR